MTTKLAGTPPLLAAAAAIVAAQGLLVAVLGGWVGVDALRGGADSLPAAETLALVGVVAGVGLVLVARGLLRRRRWSRSPTVLTQLLCVPVAITVARADHYVIGVLLGLTALAAGFCAMSGQVASALEPPSE